MSGLTPNLVETATKIATTITEDGDINYAGGTASACLYRDISTLNHVQNRNEIAINGLLWFDPTESVVKGDVYSHPDEGYLQIVKVTRAKRLVADNSVQFIKCEVIKQRQIS
jgi:hypothetical protein